jgi:hypothetical protein
LDIRSLGDHLGRCAAIAKAYFEHPVARLYAKRRDDFRVPLLIVLVEPVGYREADDPSGLASCLACSAGVRVSKAAMSNPVRRR